MCAPVSVTLASALSLSTILPAIAASIVAGIVGITCIVRGALLKPRVTGTVKA